MEFYEVDRLPDRVLHRRRIQNTGDKRRAYLEDELEKFMKMDVKYARLDYGDEYKTPGAVSSSLKNAIKKEGLPIKVTIIDSVIYLISTDM